MLLRSTILLCASALAAAAQLPPLNFLKQSTLDAHNCYPYQGKWTNRIDRALSAGFPLSIEQDLAWYVDPVTRTGRVVVTHTPETHGTEPTLEAYFFEHVRPIIEKALKENQKEQWPLIVLHFDFKDNQAPLLHAVWNLLGEYEPWLTTAERTADIQKVADFEVRPILVITEDSDAQQQVFFDQVPVGSKLRVFGSAHTNLPVTKSSKESDHLEATLPPETLLTERANNYRRWWNNSWHEVEEGGQPSAGSWNEDKMTRLRSLVSRAHERGYWIRFYTLDGFSAEANEGWSLSYNFGSLTAAQVRWEAAKQAGVNMIATDQYEALGAFLQRSKTAH